MLIFALALAMAAGLVSATAVALHNEAEASRIKIAARRHRPIN
ncbi:hypothetical protein [Aureimonas sp. SA4125]|nr:hypothetical protein [Aureimonas sp. SA4125]